MAFGNMVLLLRYLLLKNKVTLNDIEIEYQGSMSYFISNENNE